MQKCRHSSWNLKCQEISISKTKIFNENTIFALSRISDSYFLHCNSEETYYKSKAVLLLLFINESPKAVNPSWYINHQRVYCGIDRNHGNKSSFCIVNELHVRWFSPIFLCSTTREINVVFENINLQKRIENDNGEKWLIWCFEKWCFFIDNM